MKTTTAKRSKGPAKVTIAQAQASASVERDRVIGAAIEEVRRSQCFTDMVIYGHPFPLGADKPATRTLGFRRPNEELPAGCDDVARIPVSCLSREQAVRMLTDRAQNFPVYNCAAIA